MQQKSKENQSVAAEAYRFADFDLYPSERRLRLRQKAVLLPPKAFDALLLFVQNADRLVRRDQLIEALWPDTYVTDANLTNIIVILRKIVGKDAIQTVSKYGYRFTLQVVGEPGIDQTTYATFLRAKELAVLRSLESMVRARDLFWLCVAKDPMFAPAWAWLGRCCRFLEKFKMEPSANLDLGQAALRRALTIDPNLACAHHFYTQLQADLGQARDAMVRLAERLAQGGDEPESFAGLVQVMRFCGLLEESVAAHERATTLDPAIVTSVCHTHFLRCEYEATLQTYGATRYYLDAAAWAALGDRRRATELLRERLAAPQLSPLMSGLMGSLLAILEGRRKEAAKMMKETVIVGEPEVLFYFARHFSMLGATSECIQMLRRARLEGFTSSRTLEQDEAFAPMRRHSGFESELRSARSVERRSRNAFKKASGAHSGLLRIVPLARRRSLR